MDKLMLVRKSQFGSLTCDYYGDNSGEFFMTRQQIGEALGYDNPMIAIAKFMTDTRIGLISFQY